MKIARNIILYIVILLFSYNLVEVSIAHALDQDKVAIETILLESRGESYVGQVAVGEVIRNRAKERHQGIIEVCIAPYQFSCWNDSQVAEKVLKGVSGEEWQIASRAWAESETSNYAGGATHYLAKKRLKSLPSWVKNLKEILTIDRHTFYKEY